MVVELKYYDDAIFWWNELSEAEKIEQYNLWGKDEFDLKDIIIRYTIAHLNKKLYICSNCKSFHFKSDDDSNYQCNECTGNTFELIKDDDVIKCNSFIVTQFSYSLESIYSSLDEFILI